MSHDTVDIKAWIDNRPVAGYQWLIMSLCFFVVLFDGFDVAVMGFIAPSLIQDWGLSKAAFGPVMSAGMVGLAIGALTAGPYSDRLGRKKVLLIAVTGFSVLSLACAFARNPYELAALRLLTGVALGAAMPNTTRCFPNTCRSVIARCSSPSCSPVSTWVRGWAVFSRPG
jgi:AAHS family 4-hydroxybenzoate transporter-like MFS transporter